MNLYQASDPNSQSMAVAA